MDGDGGGMPLRLARTPTARLFDAMDADQLDAATLAFLNDRVRIDHYTLYRMTRPRREIIAGASLRGVYTKEWRDGVLGGDVELSRARRLLREDGCMVMITADPALMESRAAKESWLGDRVATRLIACAQREDDIYGLSLLRMQRGEAISAVETARVAEAADIVISAFARRAATYRAGRAADGMSSVETIEARLGANAPSLTRRELQVMARILYGISTIGIALDLGVGKESIATYRKRGYQRLDIATRHELMHLYLKMI